jgi:single-strand DNA-binding protein
VNAVEVRAIGRLGADPELRFVPSGTAVVQFSLACSDRIRQDDGTWADGPVTWLRCTAWGTLAENVAEKLRKGMRAVVVGALQEKTFDRADSTTGKFLEVKCDEASPSLRFEQTKRESQQSEPFSDPF